MAAARAQLAGLSEVGELSQFVTSRRTELIRSARGLPGVQRTRLLSDLVDLVVRRMLEVACDVDGRNLAAKAERFLTIAATGGYGRRELAPFSDVDINFIAGSEDDPDVDIVTRRMFRLIMDVFLAGAKLKVGYAYRLLSETATLHHQNQTALLDSRYVAGSRDLFQAFQSELRRGIHPVAFIHDKLREREASIRKSGAGVYRVEPDVKSGEGSLRDLQLARWLAQAVYGFANKTVWDDIRRHGVLKAAEVQGVQETQEFYSRLRWEMHVAAGQQADVLTSQKQETVAPLLGYTDTPELSAAEHLMRDYYSRALFARQTAVKMMSRAQSLRLELEPGLCSQYGRVVLDNPEAFSNDPLACLRVFIYCQRYGLTLDQEVVDALKAAVAAQPAPSAQAEASRLFLVVLRGERVAETLSAMSRAGVLQWYMPEFADIIGLVPADAAHEYTVGWHSLLVVKECERLGASGDEDTRRIFSAIRQKEMLYLLALTHDVGKARHGEDHCETGAAMVRGIAERLGLDEGTVDRLEYLVRHHVLMSDTARLRDLNLRRTVEDFVAVVNDVEVLGMLYIFTTADISSVGSASWSEIQARFLRELYYRAERAIVSKTPLIASEEEMALYRRRVRRELSLANVPPEAVEEHVRLMPAIYLLNTGPEEMAMHIEAIQTAIQGEPSVDFRAEPGSDFTVLTICVRDDPLPGLLSKVAGVLWALEINVHAAQVFTREGNERIALDTIFVDFEGSQLPDFKRQQVEKDLCRVLKGDVSVSDLLTEKKKALNGGYESVSLDVFNQLSEQHTVVEIHAKDQPGLLYRFTRAFAALNWGIHSARVSTWGDEARDSFYVTAEGRKLGTDAGEDLEAALRSVR